MKVKMAGEFKWGTLSVLVTFLWCIVFTGKVFAAQVSEIKIVGNKKIEKAAILKKISIVAGDELSLEKVTSDVQALFETGFFQDVEVSENSSGAGKVAVTYKVVEKPSMVLIEYKGNSELDDDELSELTKLKIYEIIDYAKINKGVSEIQKAYEEKGYYIAKVTYSVRPDPKGAGAIVTFHIEENDQVVVKRISFIGNDSVPASEIKSKMQTQEGGFFGSAFGGTFKQDAFEKDTQLVSFLYFNKGYVQAKVSRPEVSVTPDKKGIYISIRVDEGRKFDTGEVSFSGDILFSTQELMDATSIDESKVFVYEKVQADLRTLQAKYGDLGYAYANIIPRTFVKEKEGVVDIVYEFDKGKKVYFGTISVVGNSKTRDKVVRRELRIGEGQLYNETLKRESEANIRRLGFFEQVQFNVKTPKGRDDLMDVDIVVKERNTGSFQLGAGYSSFSGPIFNAQLNQTNFLGKGWRTGLQVDYSRVQKRYRLNFTEPYFYDSLWSVGFDIFRNENNFDIYQEKVEGVAMRVGHPLFSNRYLYGFIRYKLDRTDIGLTEGQQATDILKESSVDGTSSSITLTAEYDKRNDRFAPSKGIHSSLSHEYSGLGGKIRYNKSLAFFRWYQRLFWSVVLRTNFTYGMISTSGDREIPFNQLFRLGGPYNLRGFDFNDIGRRRFSRVREQYLLSQGFSAEESARAANIVFGGAQQAYTIVELEFPLVKEAGIRGVVFYDIGTAEDDLVANQFRSDVGFGVRWFSPIGPLRFEWGFPLERKAGLGEEASEFHFAIGAPF